MLDVDGDVVLIRWTKLVVLSAYRLLERGVIVGREVLLEGLPHSEGIRQAFNEGFGSR